MKKYSYFLFSDTPPYKKGDIITNGYKKFIVKKVFKGWNKWKKFLNWLGFKVRINQIKIYDRI